MDSDALIDRQLRRTKPTFAYFKASAEKLNPFGTHFGTFVPSFWTFLPVFRTKRTVIGTSRFEAWGVDDSRGAYGRGSAVFVTGRSAG